MSEPIILASKSAARRAVLTGAGVPFEVAVAGVDEDAVKTSMLAQGATPASRTGCIRRWWWPGTGRRSGARSSRRP